MAKEEIVLDGHGHNSMAHCDGLDQSDGSRAGSWFSELQER